MNNLKVQPEEQVYSRLKLLGQGAFGKAYLVKQKATDALCVIKQMNISEMSAAEQEQTYKQAKILSALNHPNIVKFKDVYVTTNKKLNIVMEYADGGDISKRIAEQKKLQKPFPQTLILDWFTQLCLAIKHVHDRKIIHRDIKGQNVFITKNNMLKLGDFGIARILNRTMEKARTVVGTPYYLSPEIIENKPYSFKSDIWSMGVMLYQMCALQPPFNANSLQFLALKIVKGSYQPLQGNFSKEIKSLIGSMLSIDPNRRPSAKEILQLPFILSRINNFLTQTQNKVEFSHTVLHNFKLNFKVPNVQQLNQAQQTPQQSQQPQQQLQPISYEGQVKRLKEQQIQIERSRQARRQAEIKKDEQRKQQKAMEQQRKCEEKKRAEQYQRLIDIKKKEVEMAKRRVQEEQQRVYEQQMKDERREREEKIQLNKKQKIEEDQKLRLYQKQARDDYFRNQQIRKNAEKRAQMEQNYQSEPPRTQTDNPTPSQLKKPSSNEIIKQQPPVQKPNYHFKGDQPAKPIVEAYKQLQQPTPQRPSSQNKNRQPELVVDDEQLMNAFVNPNFKRKVDQPQKPTQPKKQERPTSVQPKKQVKLEAPKEDKTDLKKKILQGRMKMRQDRQKHHGGSTGDFGDAIVSEEVTQPSITDETLKAAKWDKPRIPCASSPQAKIHSTALGDTNDLESQRPGKQQVPVVKVNLQDIERVIQENQLLEKMLEEEMLEKDKQSIELQNMIQELIKVVNFSHIQVDDVQEKVDALPDIKPVINVRKDDEKQPERAVDFHENTVYEASDANLQYFSDYSKLESLRITLQDVFGTDNFIKIYRIIEKEYELNEMAGMELDRLQKKINFISEEQFAQNYTLLLTLVLMENTVDEQARSPNR